MLRVKKQKPLRKDGINIGWVYAVAKEGTGFAGDGSLDIVTADGTIIKGVVARVPVKLEAFSL